MDGVLLDGERGFLDRFAQGRVGMNGATEVLAASTEFHDRDDFCDQFGSGMGENRGTENAISLGIGDELDHAFDVLVRQRTAVGPEREFADAHFEPSLFREIFRDTDTGQFRIRAMMLGMHVVIFTPGLPAINS